MESKAPYFYGDISIMTELEIRTYLRQMREGNSQAALRKFYNLCFDRFFRIAYYYLQKEEWAQEVVLDVFQRTWEKREILDRIDNLEDYFFITVKNTSLNYLEKELRREDHTSELSGQTQAMANSPEDILISEELFAHYLKALDLLPERCREIFIRIREEKQTYAQVAQELGISPNTVDVHMQKAITRLRESLREYTSLNI